MDNKTNLANILPSYVANNELEDGAMYGVKSCKEFIDKIQISPSIWKIIIRLRKIVSTHNEWLPDLIEIIKPCTVH